MSSITVAPGLVLGDDMFELAHLALTEYVPEEAARFTWERFTDREGWVLVPDTEHPELPWYKAEFLVTAKNSFDRTMKLNIWQSPDLRRSGAPMPHSHPWEFTGHVLTGGYVESRYQVSNPDQLLADRLVPQNIGLAGVSANVTHLAGDDNTIELPTFHEVTEILDPGRTLSLMDCGAGLKDGWGYLDPNTGLYTPVKQSPIDPLFLELLFDRNPHLRG